MTEVILMGMIAVALLIEASAAIWWKWKRKINNGKS